ncbi:MAG TPA: HAD family hydrolase, partial [Woeseiaceae bacterium]|nr:HAD family hydrolase [Woeseiaceae bacterium]
MTEAVLSSGAAVILFDLGGVLLQLRDIGSNFGLRGDETQFLRSWLMSPAVRDFERGSITAEEFGRRIVGELRLPYDWREFLQRFDRWPESIYPGVPELLEELSAGYNLALLSNTNAVHWGRDDIAGILEPLFDGIFLSFRTGLLKPDRASFEQIMRHYECAAGDILFLD